MTRHFSRFLVVAMLLAPLAACGFSPLYADHTGVTDQFQQIKVVDIPDRDGQMLRNDILDRLYKNGVPEDPKYLLTISSVQERSTEVDILPTSDATRDELRFLTYMTLSDAKTGEILLQRDLLQATSYNILGSEFTNIVSQENVRTNAINALAQDVETQLALYFARQTPKDGPKDQPKDQP